MIDFSIKNRWTGEVQFTAKIDASEDTPLGVKIGLAVKWAIGARANTYRYVICSVVDGTKTQATRDAKILVWRQEQMLAALRFPDVTAIDGSKIGRILNTKDTYYLRSNVALWQRSTSGNDNMYGLAITAFALTGATA